MGKVKKVISILTMLLLISMTWDVDASELLSGNKYESKKLDKNIGYMSRDIDNNLSEDVIAKRKAMEEYKVLVPKTDSKYEIALAYSDGSYEYVSSSNYLEDAITIANQLNVAEDVLPAVINDNGNVVYSTNAMGRVLVYRDGNFVAGDKNTSLIYEDSNMLKEYTYINQDYMDDTPLIEQQVGAAKIQISGFTGWMKTDNDTGNYDLVVIPMNQVKDPSFYYVEDGLMYHYISTDMTKEHVRVNDWDPELGQAPVYMVEGVKYFSYDGKYFYTGETDSNALNKLVTDLKNNTYENSINYNEAYYNYYNIMPYRTKSDFNADELNWVINNHINRYGLYNSKLVDIGESIIEAQNTYGVNATLILALAIHESAWGTSEIAQSKNNLFGLNAIDKTPGESADYYKSVNDCIMDYAKNYVSEGYTNPSHYRYFGGFTGNKANGANVKYASDPFWGEKVAQYAFKIDYRINGRDINNLTEMDNYSIVKTNSNYEVVDENGNIIYTSRGNGVTLALAENDIIDINGENYYKVNLEIPSVDNQEANNYDWTKKGYIKADSLQSVVTARDSSSKYILGDINYDEKVDILDVSELSVKYNTTSEEVGWNSFRDLNKDGIIDLFDIVLIANRL